MKKLLLIILVLTSTISTAFAAIDPINKECGQRNYQILGGYCIFPDGEKCLLEAFNEGTCGQSYKIGNYCTKEGTYVWDEDRCCAGLVAYLPKDMPGQMTCIKISEARGGSNFLANPLFLIYILPTLILLGLLIGVKAFKKKSEKKFDNN